MCTCLDEWAGDRDSVRQEHGHVPLLAREGCIWALLQTASRKEITAQQKCLRRLRKEHDLQTQGMLIFILFANWSLIIYI